MRNYDPKKHFEFLNAVATYLGIIAAFSGLVFVGLGLQLQQHGRLLEAPTTEWSVVDWVSSVVTGSGGILLLATIFNAAVRIRNWILANEEAEKTGRTGHILLLALLLFGFVGGAIVFFSATLELLRGLSSG